MSCSQKVAQIFGLLTRHFLRANFCFHLCTTFNGRNVFQSGVFKTEKTFEFRMNERFETNMGITVNSIR